MQKCVSCCRFACLFGDCVEWVVGARCQTCQNRRCSIWAMAAFGRILCVNLYFASAGQWHFWGHVDTPRPTSDVEA
eukprot:6362291-Amphidinium_carterae.1